MMKRLGVALPIVLCLQSSLAFGQTGECQREIAQIEQLVQSRKETPEYDETAQAKLHRQPTAQSMAQASKEAWNELDDRLAKARILAQKQDVKGCMAMVREIKLSLGATN